MYDTHCYIMMLQQSDSRSEVSSLARSDSTGSTQSLQHASLPEMLLGLAYNGTTGRLNVSIIKGNNNWETLQLISFVINRKPIPKCNHEQSTWHLRQIISCFIKWSGDREKQNKCEKRSAKPSFQRDFHLSGKKKKQFIQQ